MHPIENHPSRNWLPDRVFRVFQDGPTTASPFPENTMPPLRPLQRIQNNRGRAHRRVRFQVLFQLFYLPGAFLDCWAGSTTGAEQLEALRILSGRSGADKNVGVMLGLK